VVYHFEGGRLVRSEESTARDGRFDLVSFYEGDAIARQEARTTCGADRPDVWIVYRNGQKATQEQDQDCDGRPDVRFVYEGAALVRKEAVR
jgi:hypothetical protein